MREKIWDLTPEEQEEFREEVRKKKEDEINLAMNRISTRNWFGDRNSLYKSVEKKVGWKLYEKDKKYVDDYVRRA